MIIKRLQVKSSNSTSHSPGDQTKHVWLCAVFVLRVEGEMGGGGVFTCGLGGGWRGQINGSVQSLQLLVSFHRTCRRQQELIHHQ